MACASFFLAKTAVQASKRLKASEHLVNKDFLVLSEARFTGGGAQAFVDPPGSHSYWASGMPARARVGIIVKETFLQQFDLEAPSWITLEPG
jgi:hypothetical protein